MKAITRAPDLRHPGVQRGLALLFLIVCACAMPFLGQPFHMDDNFYMDMARNARVNPLFPNDTPYIFIGEYGPDVGSHSHPPLQTYLLAALQSLFGEQPGVEWIYHLCSLIFPLMAVFSAYFLAARFVERPLWPSLLLAAAPVFQVMSRNLMTDVPTLAFWLAAAACFVWGIDLEKKSLLAASSFFQFGAMFASYQAVALSPLLGFYLLRRRRNAAAWIALAVPLALLAIWFGLTSAHFGRLILADTVDYVRSREAVSLGVMTTKLVALLQYQGWLVLFPLLLLYALARGLKGRLLALAALASTYLAQTLVPEYRLLDKIIFVTGAVAGVFSLAQMAALAKCSFFSTGEAAGFDRKDGQFLSLWYFGVVCYCLILFTEGSARYILPLLLPFLMVFFRRLEVAETAEYRQPVRPYISAAMVASGSLVLTLAWALTLAHADWELARIYPRAAADARQAAGALPWYFGGEWGFRYYARQSGGLQLPRDESEVEGGGLVVRPRLALPYEMQAALSSMTMPFESFTYHVGTRLRTIDRQSPAGFYSTGWGMIPFSFSDQPAEVVEILQVSFLAARLPDARIECESPIHPWPGYVRVGDRNELALLLESGTRVVYPWAAEAPLELEVRCGIGSVRGGASPGARYYFELQQRDARGRVLSRTGRSIGAQSGAGSDAWPALRFRLQPAAESGQTLELYFRAEDGDSAVGAFAGGALRPLSR